MISSKPKSNFAYAKICKEKSADEQTSKHLTPRSKKSQYPKQNICEQLMNDLEATDSQYIHQLLLKQQRKCKKEPNQLHPTHMKDAFRDSSNQYSNQHPTQELRKKGTQTALMGKVLSPIKSQNVNSSPLPHTPNLHEDPSLTYYMEKPSTERKCEFISQISHYLTQLNRRSGHGPTKQTYHKQRQAGKTRQGGQWCEETEWKVSSKKYTNVLNQLQAALQANDTLEERLDVQEQKMEEMSKIIAMMSWQMEPLQRRLQQVSRQKHKYKEMLEEFASKIKKVKSGSRERNSFSKHKKRNSHIPISSEFQEDGQYRKSDLSHLLENRSKFDISHLIKNREDEFSLKKKGKHHIYKSNDHYPDPDEYDPHSTATIYHDRYQ